MYYFIMTSPILFLASLSIYSYYLEGRLCRVWTNILVLLTSYAPPMHRRINPLHTKFQFYSNRENFHKQTQYKKEGGWGYILCLDRKLSLDIVDGSSVILLLQYTTILITLVIHILHIILVSSKILCTASVRESFSLSYYSCVC